ncbi:hypothetical protein PMIN06_000159 [Paraphaeosphaeria minitans]
MEDYVEWVWKLEGSTTVGFVAGEFSSVTFAKAVNAPGLHSPDTAEHLPSAPDILLYGDLDA